MVLSNFLVDEQPDASEVGLLPLTALSPLCTVPCNLLLLNNKQNKNCCFVTASLFFREKRFESSVCVISSPVRSCYIESSFKLLSWRTNPDIIVHISAESGVVSAGSSL